MSHTLSRLREHFGDPLLVASGRELTLTKLAESLLGPTASAVQQLEQVLVPPVAFEPTTSTRTFHLVTTDNLGLYVLPRLAALFEREAPRLRLRVHSLSRVCPESGVASARG